MNALYTWDDYVTSSSNRFQCPLESDPSGIWCPIASETLTSIYSIRKQLSHQISQVMGSVVTHTAGRDAGDKWVTSSQIPVKCQKSELIQ